ncbi:mite allergen Der f 3-like [Oppia nitens]|uniref:mite allergen Der f 3-like n=1 Tax=Oppia nitens TaxID=1686743 RepID=UPI0023DCBAB8|nr:mite allergen Der f 3-like [Oppia nitens]
MIVLTVLLLLFIDGIYVTVTPLSYIVRGTDAQPGEFTWMAAILDNKGDLICGGGIIDQKSILTSAKCIQKYDALDLRVRVGSLKYDSGGTVFTVGRTIIHPLYDKSSYINDIAIIKLSNPIHSFDYKTVAPITISIASRRLGLISNLPVYMAGWGNTGSLFHSTSSSLQKVTLEIVGHNKCQKTYGSTQVDDSQLCAGVADGKLYPSTYDEGGILSSDPSTPSIALGIYSWTSKWSAIYTYPEIYTRISSYYHWIKHNLD